jgi:PTS system ascorbate-specific IIC component
MQIFEFILALVKLPAMVLGLIALVGLVAQRKPASDVLVGTVKTILGLLIMSVGIGAINALIPIQAMFERVSRLGIRLLRHLRRSRGGAVQSANVGRSAPPSPGPCSSVTPSTSSWRVALPLHLPDRTHDLDPRRSIRHPVYSFGLPLVWVVVLASITDGLYMTLAPALAQPTMRKIIGNEIAFGHGQTLLNVFCAWAGKFVGKPEDTAEDLKVPEGLNFFRDMAVSISLVMLVVVLVGSIWRSPRSGWPDSRPTSAPAKTGWSSRSAGAGLHRRSVGPAARRAHADRRDRSGVQGVAERIIPGDRPALDCPVIYPFAPNSLIIGMIAGTIGQVLAMIALALIGWPVPLPSMIAAFFASGAGAIFGNATGGRRAAWLGGFIWGFVAWFIILARQVADLR